MAGSKDGEVPGAQVHGIGTAQGDPRGRAKPPRHLPRTGGPHPREAGGTAEKPDREGIKEAETAVSPCGPEGHAGNQIRWRDTFNVLMKRAGTLCRKPFTQLNLQIIRWSLRSVYVFLEHGTVRVPSETSVPEGIAIVLL